MTPQRTHEPARNEPEELEVRLGGVVLDGNAVRKVLRDDGADAQGRCHSQNAAPARLEQNTEGLVAAGTVAHLVTAEGRREPP